MPRICVYCGSRTGDNTAFAEAARALAGAIADRHLGLVFGGASIGMMGAVADGVLARGGEVIGVIPQALMSKEVAHEGVSELVVTAGMHGRKQTMVERSDGFIALPGGLGTLEELFEILTWAQLRFHTKPCGLLNVSGYFDHLIAFFDHAIDQGFIDSNHRVMLRSAETPGMLLDALGFPLPTASRG